MVALVASVALCAPSGLLIGVGAKSAEAATPAYTWPEFHNNSKLTGSTADPTITATNASTLGVKWMSPVGPALDSPMVAYNQTLKTTLVFEGAADGFFEALNAANGQIVWSDNLETSITSSPLVEDGNVWIAPQSSGRLYKLDAATGAVECSAPVANTVLATPVVATPPGGAATVYLGSLGQGSTNGPIVAYTESDCAVQWQWSNYVIPGQNTGTWAPLSYGVDASGVGLLLVGSANPDSEVYAINAATGVLVWHFATYCPPSEDWDVGGGTVISAPGVNGFADGMAYVEGKDGIFNALNLTTGSRLWSYNFGGNSATNPTITNTDAVDTTALSGTTLVFGDTKGLYALNAVTGKKLWFLAGTGDIEASPIIVGPSNLAAKVVAYGDLNGNFHVVSLSSGKVLYSYKTGNYITASAADVDGNLLVASDDGFLYDFGLGGANSPIPTTAVTAPSAGADLANPNGSLTISGTAKAADGVAAVTVQVQANGATGPWFDQASGSFAPGLSSAQATLASPGAPATNWTLTLPVPVQAASYQVLASAVGVNGIADGTAYTSAANAAAVQFQVQASSSAPIVTVSTPRVAPGGTFTLSASGFEAKEVVVFTAKTSTGSTVTLAQLTTEKSGITFPKLVTLPATSAFGPDAITATGKTSGRVGVGSVYASNDDPQIGYGPMHQGAEPNDPVILDYQAVGGKSKLVQDWSVAGDGPFDSTPAIDQGVIYYGDEAGNFYAVAETTGQPLFTTSVGSAIESSPAIDDGTAFFGDDAGVLTAVNATTGASGWSTSLGSKLSSVAVEGGVVYVGDTAGNLVALDESTGTVDWTVSLGGSITSAPAITGDLVIATTTKGSVEAVSASTGAVAWTHSIGGSATGPMVVGTTIYVGSTNGSVYALKQASGTIQWSAAVGSAITAAPILTYNSFVTVGTAVGDIDYFNPTSGSLSSTQTQFGHPVTGLAYTNSILLITSSSGQFALIQGSKYLKVTWQYTAPAGYASPGVILNGDIFVLGEDGLLRALTVPGRAVT